MLFHHAVYMQYKFVSQYGMQYTSLNFVMSPTSTTTNFHCLQTSFKMLSLCGYHSHYSLHLHPSHVPPWF